MSKDRTLANADKWEGDTGNKGMLTSKQQWLSN